MRSLFSFVCSVNLRLLVYVLTPLSTQREAAALQEEKKAIEQEKRAVQEALGKEKDRANELVMQNKLNEMKLQTAVRELFSFEFLTFLLILPLSSFPPVSARRPRWLAL